MVVLESIENDIKLTRNIMNGANGHTPDVGSKQSFNGIDGHVTNGADGTDGADEPTSNGIFKHSPKDSRRNGINGNIRKENHETTRGFSYPISMASY
jgi:hypothetical protein